MAFESRYWRSQIKRDITFLMKKLEVRLASLIPATDYPDDLDKLYSQVEIKLFTITYSLRKLMDTKRFPDRVSEKKIKAKRYQRNNKKSLRPFGLFEDYYDLNLKGAVVSLELREVCNQFTHAYFFEPIPNAKGCIGTIFFVSDRYKNKCIYSLNIKSFLNQIFKIVDEFPTATHFVFDKAKKEFVITANN